MFKEHYQRVWSSMKFSLIGFLLPTWLTSVVNNVRVFLICCLSPPSVTGTACAGDYWAKSGLIRLQNEEPAFLKGFHPFFWVLKKIN